ncbi:hybrid signal transduction histidine kinase M [Tanacetum coccineum]
MDIEKHNYSSWSSFFIIHLGSLGIKSHVEEETSSSTTNPEWCKLDDFIKMWILGSLCDSLQEQVVTTPGNAKALWDHLQNLFHDNKDARAINLDNELRSIKIGKMSINEYCTKIKSMADRLKNLGCVVSDKNLVIYVVNELDSCFATVFEIIRHREPFPTFETTRNMLRLKESSMNDQSSASTTFESSSSSPTILARLAQLAPQQAMYSTHHQPQHGSPGILGPTPALYPSQPTSLPSAFSTMTLPDPTWNIDIGVVRFLDSRSRKAGETQTLIPLVRFLDSRSREVGETQSMFLSFSKHKFYADGTLSRYKARMVANDSSHQLGVDFYETFSPVVKPSTIRTVLSLVVSRKWPIHQLIVKNAFLNSDLSETVYMHQPSGFVNSRYTHHVCLLQRSLYGLKQAPRAWFQRLLLFIYVDDIILTTSSPALLQQIIDSLHSEFDMTDLGALNYFLGICVVCHHIGLFLSQRKYALQLLEHTHMVNCNPSRTLVDTEFKLLHSPLSTATLVYCDNVSAIYMSANPVQHQRTKYIEIDIHSVRDMVTAS